MEIESYLMEIESYLVEIESYLMEIHSRGADFCEIVIDYLKILMEYFRKVVPYCERRGVWGLLPRHDFLDVVELVERFEGREVVDVETQDFVAHLTEHGVVELEEGELHAFA